MARNLVRWEPWSDLMSLREAMDRLFEDADYRLAALAALLPDLIDDSPEKR